MDTNRQRSLAFLFLLAGALSMIPAAQAQPRRELERERFHTQHWVYDDRFHRNPP